MVSSGDQLSIEAADLLVRRLGEPVMASPMARLLQGRARTRVGIVTCGGLCPGLNNVIRGLVLELSENYGVTNIVGYRDGYRGLVSGEEPMRLTPALVADIHNHGGTILGTSRGGQDPAEILATLVRHEISVLMVIGGDGTLRAAEEIADAAAERGVMLSVV